MESLTRNENGVVYNLSNFKKLYKNYVDNILVASESTLGDPSSTLGDPSSTRASADIKSLARKQGFLLSNWHLHTLIYANDPQALWKIQNGSIVIYDITKRLPQ